MSFGTSAGDAILLVQLAWKTVQGARQACGEHDELTREVVSLHKVLLRLQREYENPDSLLARADDDRRQEMGELCSGCEEVLKVMDQIISKYNALSEEKRSGKRLWQKIQFGNGEMQDLAEIRLKLSAHTSAILLSVNLCSLGSQGRMEKRLSDAGGDLEGIRSKVNWIAANMSARSGDGSVWSSYTNDDKGFWRELRRGLVQEGYRSSVLHRHKHLIKQYVEELGNRGVFDETHDAEPSDGHKGEDDSSSADGSDSEKDREDIQSENIETGAQSSGLENRDDERPGKEVSSNDPLSALDYQGNLKPEFAALGEATISSPENTDVFGSSLFPPKSPKSPKGPKYLRFDKQIHIGSINPQARRARTPEEQEAHDNRKEARKSRTPEQQTAHENRKKERKLKRKTSVVHAVTEIEFRQSITSESSPGKHVQMEEITDEEFLPTDREGEILNESGRGLDVQTEFRHSKTDSQVLTSDSTNTEPSKDSAVDVSQLAEGLGTENPVKLQSEYEVPSQAENVNSIDTFKRPVPLPPQCEVMIQKAKKKRPRAKPPGILTWMSGRERPQVTKSQKGGNP